MKLLQKHTNTQAEIKKEWSENEFEQNTQKIYNIIKKNFYNTVKYTAGAKPKYGYIDSFTSSEDIEELFGLPYTSNDRAILWNTNTQAEAKTNQIKLYFRGAGIDENNKAFLMFQDKKEQNYYFYDYDFKALITELQEIDRAEDLQQFIKDCNTAKNITIDILKSYTNKAYGEKTKEKIYNEISEKTKDYNFYYIYLSDSYLHISKYITGGKSEQSYYLKFLDNNNKINLDYEQIKNQNKQEFDGKKTLKEAQELKTEIINLCKTLLPLVENYNELKTLLQQDTKDTSTYSFNLSSLAKYDK